MSAGSKHDDHPGSTSETRKQAKFGISAASTIRGADEEKSFSKSAITDNKQLKNEKNNKMAHADDGHDSFVPSFQGEEEDGHVIIGGGEQEHFPLKLHKLLEQLEMEGKQQIIGWNADGKSFSVFKPKEFASTIMRKHFRRQSQYKSFQRQLNLYAFKRKSFGKVKGVYSHDLFVRDDRELCKGMKRQRAPIAPASSSSMNDLCTAAPVAGKKRPSTAMGGDGHYQQQAFSSRNSSIVGGSWPTEQTKGAGNFQQQQQGTVKPTMMMRHDITSMGLGRRQRELFDSFHHQIQRGQRAAIAADGGGGAGGVGAGRVVTDGHTIRGASYDSDDIGNLFASGRNQTAGSLTPPFNPREDEDISSSKLVVGGRRSSRLPPGGLPNQGQEEQQLVKYGMPGEMNGGRNRVMNASFLQPPFTTPAEISLFVPMFNPSPRGGFAGDYGRGARSQNLRSLHHHPSSQLQLQQPPQNASAFLSGLSGTSNGTATGNHQQQLERLRYSLPPSRVEEAQMEEGDDESESIETIDSFDNL